MRTKPTKPFHRLLLTGAAGKLGRVLRRALAPHTEILRLSDRLPIDAVAAHEEAMQVELGDASAVHALLEGVDAVVHFGGVPSEGRFAPILEANIVGVFNLYEAARKHGVKRIVFASSNHVIGFYRQGEVIDSEVPMRPDGLYGVSKCFGENLSRCYFDRYGIETVCLRIGSATERVSDQRMLSTYLALDDLVELTRCALVAPDVGHCVVYGVSDNQASWWDNRTGARLGFVPRASADGERERILRECAPLAESDPARIYQGGAMVTAGPFEDQPPK